MWLAHKFRTRDLILNQWVSNSGDQLRNIINLDLFSHEPEESFLFDVPKQWLEIGLQMGGSGQGQVGESSFINKRSNLKHLTERFRQAFKRTVTFQKSATESDG